MVNGSSRLISWTPHPPLGVGVPLEHTPAHVRVFGTRNPQSIRRTFRRGILALQALATAGLILVMSNSVSKAADPPANSRPVPNRPTAINQGELRRTPQGVVAGETNADAATAAPAGLDVEKMLSPGGLPSTLKIMLMLTVLSLAPSILIMTTSFIRFVIVLSLLRQALGTQQLPPNQVIVSLSLFLTFLIMAPVWKQSYHEGIRPYTSPEAGRAAVTLEEAYHNTVRPLRRFMIDQIDKTGNGDAIWMFLEFQRPDPDTEGGRNYVPPENYEDVDTVVLLPAFMMSELKTAFLIGFMLYLPFLVIDMVISSVLISMGMMMMPPVLISIPFKLLLFVMIDGWHITVGMLLDSVRMSGSG